MNDRLQKSAVPDLALAGQGAFPNVDLERLSVDEQPEAATAFEVATDRPLNVRTDLAELRGMPVNILTVDAEDPTDSHSANTLRGVKIAGYEGEGDGLSVAYTRLGAAPKTATDPLTITMPLTGSADFKKDGQVKLEYWQINKIQPLCTQTVLLMTDDAVTRQMKEDRSVTRGTTLGIASIDVMDAIRASYGTGSKLQIELTNERTEKVTFLEAKSTPAGDALVVEQDGERKLIMVDDIGRMRPQKYYPGGEPEPTGYEIELTQ
jgi:hypothetical protein